MPIERAFGLLKIRFRILSDCLPLLNIKYIPRFIIACCVLHNICILKNDMMNFVVCRGNEKIEMVHFYDASAVLGQEKRNRIMNGLRMRLQV